MATAQAVTGGEADHHHRRTKSSALKSFIHKRTVSKGINLPSATATEIFTTAAMYDTNKPMPFLPNDHPHTRALGELQQNHQSPPPSSPRKSKEGRPPVISGKDGVPMAKKSLAGRDTDKNSKLKDDKIRKPKKAKSSTNLASLLSRPKSTKSLRKAAAEEELRLGRDKENRSPPSSSLTDSESTPPIYAQFATQHFAVQPLGGKFLEDEIDLYTPQQYSPGKQRNFYNGPGSQPTLNRRDETKRALSTYLPSNFSIQDISRHVGGSERRSAERQRGGSFDLRPAIDRKATMPETKAELTTSRRGARVMAAVASFGSKAKPVEPAAYPVPDIKDVDAEFEAMLDRRNIPEHQRYKMRSLATSMKIDFVKQDWAEASSAQRDRPSKTSSAENGADAKNESHNPTVQTKRPRSLTFTLSKSSKEYTSSTKKTGPDSVLGLHSRSKSTDSTPTYTRYLTSSSAAAASTLIAKAKGQLPDDFVAYLRRIQKPESVEVGRLHKLRLLLRNETVAWTDGFIELGGMKEIVALLQRTMKVEWREEHEDALLHEVLLCLKALCTTGLALRYLNDYQDTLFPALIHMLFDEEKKGPSEFTTRNIITSLLFTYLKSASPRERSLRAKVLLSYLKDPQPKEEERPVGFVLQMRQDRPYRVWCKEVVNVTKEVFWIFLHNLNVVPLSPSSSNIASRWDAQHHEVEPGNSTSTAATPQSTSHDITDSHLLYMQKHFPQERPPVAAAPYVGGVEWDATNYLASHLDLINGILASLETKDERTELRGQLRISGWERCMGSKLRLCKEKFYGSVHSALRNWVDAAAEDAWDVRDVRYGPQAVNQSPARKSPAKKKVDEAPKIEMLRLDLGFDERNDKIDDEWL